ncbi:hypothetical protein [Polyangium sorediatum]|uniref:Uncharacterized protein n=1 Tax=Polyangium sorediatum TaxID=889274 RepID=A0ABT6NPB2_9BACT|nr:hypothetical protein [Polyangium sorediatum]MDI1430025.1 hypothetical protein [Polyangium sorediatum]
MKWEFKNDDRGFSIEGDVGNHDGEVVGRYMPGNLKSTLEMATTLDVDEVLFLPSGYIAQVGYMRTEPTGQGLGYMLCYAAGQAAANWGYEYLFVSSGSIAGGGMHLMKKLGCGALKFLELKHKTGKDTTQVGGYLLNIADMTEKAAEGYKTKGWRKIGMKL